MVKYTLARIVLFVVALVLVVLVLPRDVNVLLKLLAALVISMIASFFLLRRWSNELATQLQAGSKKRAEEKERLRKALSGEDEK
jgi:putative flippase GtrA